MSGDAKCEDCKRSVPGYDTVHLTMAEKVSRLVCTRCFNELIARRSGGDFLHPELAPITLQDAAGGRREFHFRIRHGGAHLALEAFELEKGEPSGYQFQVLGAPNEDVLEIFRRLFERMRRALARRHIEDSDRGPQIADSPEGWMVRGQIDWDDENQGRVPRVVVDGKGYSWDEVGSMLMSFEGFHLKLEVFDRSEER